MWDCGGDRSWSSEVADQTSVHRCSSKGEQMRGLVHWESGETGEGSTIVGSRSSTLRRSVRRLSRAGTASATLVGPIRVFQFTILAFVTTRTNRSRH